MIASDRVALVHERFTEVGGSERVVEQLHTLWPGACVYAPIADPAALPDGLREAELHTSSLQALYRGGSSYAYLLPLLPLAMRQLRIRDVDLVVTSHHAFAQRVRVPPGALWVSYVHTPARWIWDPELRALEIGNSVARRGLGVFAATQRPLDRRAARRPDRIVVNSSYVAARVAHWWGQDADVVAPPVDVDRYRPDPSVAREGFFLWAGRLVPYKKPEVALRAAQRAGVRLVVAGTGRSIDALRQLAGPETTFLGGVSDDQLRDLYRRCAALVYPGVEDFGIVPVEAQACGTPVVALGIGGVVDSVLDGVTGSLYQDEDSEGEVEALARALRNFDPARYDHAVIRRHAEGFSQQAFRTQMAELCDGRPVVGDVSG